MPRSTVLIGKKTASRLRVSAGILRDNNRVLITERVGDAQFAGLWEFPGGKRAPGESASDALIRELAEELGIHVTGYRDFMTLQHDYPDRQVAIDFFLVDAWLGKPTGQMGQALRWCDLAELQSHDLLPADAPVLAALRGPD